MPRRKQTEATATLDHETTPPIAMPAQMIETEATETTETDKVKMVSVKGERKVGDQLIEFVRINKDQPIDDVIYNAGYYTQKTNPQTEETRVTLHKPQFWQAVTAASNPDLQFAPPKRAYSARAGRKPVVTVVKNGNIVVGSRHGSIAGFEAGTAVLVTAEAGRIVLTAYEEGEDAGDDLDL